jgi:hypothetical protein
MPKVLGILGKPRKKGKRLAKITMEVTGYFKEQILRTLHVL